MASILVIDDQAFERELCRDLLGGADHEIFCAASGAEALKVAKRHQPDLVLLDLFLEGESGLDICRQLAQHCPDTPIIVITATPTLEAAVECMRQGVYDFLAKPLDEGMVRLAVGRALERKALLDERCMLVERLADSNRVLRSFQKVTLTTLSAQRPNTILGKALRGLAEVTGSRGSAALLEGKGLRLPMPFPAPDSEGPSVEDLGAILAARSCQPRQYVLPTRRAGAPALAWRGPLLFSTLDLGVEAGGGVVRWKPEGAEPFRQADLTLTAGILKTLGHLLGTRLRQISLQQANRRLTRRVSHSSARMREVNSRLQKLVGEVEREKMRSFEALQRLEMINRIGQELGSFMDTEQHVQRVMRLCQETLGARIISLMLHDRETGELYIKYAFGLPEKVVEGTRVRPGDGIAGWVFSRNEPLYIGDLEEDGRFRKASLSQYETTSLVSAPVRSAGRPIGVLNVNNKADGTPFTRQDLDLLVFVSHEVGVAIENTTLYEDIQNSYFETIRALVKVLEAKDEATKGHSERVTSYCLAIGRALGLSRHTLEVLKRAGILHDLGKIAVDLSILRKEGKLLEHELQAVKKHPLVAAEIIRPMKYLDEVQKTIRQHHERHDGLGYPMGTTDICLEARILSCADAWDAMTSWRPYRDPLSVDAAVEELRRNSGTQFDPVVVSVFLDLLDKGDVDPAARDVKF